MIAFLIKQRCSIPALRVFLFVAGSGLGVIKCNGHSSDRGRDISTLYKGSFVGYIIMFLICTDYNDVHIWYKHR